MKIATTLLVDPANYLINGIVNKMIFNAKLHKECMDKALEIKMKEEIEANSKKFINLKNSMEDSTREHLSRTDSSWLSANLSCDNHTILIKDKFKTTLFLRHNLLVLNLPLK